MSVISSRLMSRVLLGVATALLVGCGLLWAFAAQQLGNYLHQPAFNGAAFADFCSASEISGFPFRLKLTCADFRAPLASGEGALVVGADEVTGIANLWSPEHVTLSFSSPVALRDAKGGFAKLRHDGATLAFFWDDARGLTQAEVNARALDWRPEVLDAGPAFNVQALRFSARPSSRDGADSLRVELGVDGLTAPILQNMLGDSQPSAIAVAGDLYPLLPPNDSWRQALEEWRQAQGTARIDKGEWRWGELSAQFDGVLNLDDAHRLAGTLDVKARGAGQIAARLGLPLNLGAASALVSALLGGKPSVQDKSSQDDSIAMTLRLAQGIAFLGPLKLAALPPLY